MGGGMVRHGVSAWTILLALVAATLAVLLPQNLAQARVATVEKTGPEAVLARQDFSYTITIRTDGTAAENVVLTDPLPVGVDLNGPLPTGCTSANDPAADQITVTCNLGTIPADTTRTVVLNVEAPDDATQDIQNTATVTSTGDTDPSNPVATDVLPSADLVITKRANPDPVDVGDNLAFTLRVANRGPQAAPNVVLEDNLPGNVQVIGTDRRCGVETGQIVVCNLGTLEPNTFTTVRVVVEPERAGTVNNTAQVESGRGDPNPGNNAASVSVTVEDNTGAAATPLRNRPPLRNRLPPLRRPIHRRTAVTTAARARRTTRCPRTRRPGPWQGGPPSARTRTAT